MIYAFPVFHKHTYYYSPLEQRIIYINTIITVFFQSLPRNVARGLRCRPSCKIGVMTDGNIPLQVEKNPNYYCIHCSDMVVTYQRETKLFQCSRNTNREELEMKENDVTFNGVVTVVSL